MNLHDRAAALCAAPAGCAFLLTVEENGLAPEVVAEPIVAVHVTAVAVAQIDPWQQDHAAIVAAALAHGPRLEELARQILTQPSAEWWFGPLDRIAQWVIVPRGTKMEPDELLTPSSPPTDWELYAQKPEQVDYSSTVAGNTCSILAAMEHLAGDYYPQFPIRLMSARPAPQSRVYEIDGPAAWHNLAAGYPAMTKEGRLAPDWGRVVETWDAVHLTLGGLLTADQVRVNGPSGWTELQGWDAEQTAWLRWNFEQVQHLPALNAFPPFPTPINPPSALHKARSDDHLWIRATRSKNGQL